LVAAGLKDRIAACKSAGRWDSAITYATELLRRYPHEDEFVALKANLLFERAVEKLSKADSESAYERNALSLKQPIADLEQYCTQYSDRGLIYELIAHLKHIRAVNLANAGLPSDALLSNEEALAYWPLDEAE
jgi:hypothetical protein